MSSVRPGTINTELGLDLYVLLYYRGIRSVDDKYRLQSAHTENKRDLGEHCDKKTTPIITHQRKTKTVPCTKRSQFVQLKY